MYDEYTLEELEEIFIKHAEEYQKEVILRNIKGRVDVDRFNLCRALLCLLKEIKKLRSESEHP